VDLEVPRSSRGGGTIGRDAQRFFSDSCLCRLLGWNVNPLVPELDVADLDRSLAFYLDTLGFRRVYERPEERFAFLDFHGAELMLEEAEGSGRRIRTAPLEPPLGRGD
jgi:hypothetical protein